MRKVMKTADARVVLAAVWPSKCPIRVAGSEGRFRCEGMLSLGFRVEGLGFGVRASKTLNLNP